MKKELEIQNQLIEAINLTLELFKDDTIAGVKWFQSPNDYLFGATPFEVCLRGDGEGLLNFLKAKLGYPDAKGF